MRRDDFVRNLRGVDAGSDPDIDMLRGIYDRIKTSEFKPGAKITVQRCFYAQDTSCDIHFASS